MNNQDREWLARIDERTQNIWRILDDQEEGITKKIDQIIEGQKIQNGSILKNTIWRKVIVGIGGSSVLLIVGWLMKLTFGG